MPMGSWKRAWTTARRIAGVQIRFHDLRHTTVTRLLDAGCTLEQISPILGWSARTMTEMMKRYQHRSLENRRKTLKALVSQREAVRTPDQVKALESLLSGNEIDILTMLRVLAEFAKSRLNISEK
jgi:transposase